MKFYLFFLIITLSNVSFASCDQFFNDKLVQMNMGTLESSPCGTDIDDSEETKKTRRSKSLQSGRGDTGPTLAMYKSDLSYVKIVQILSKDTTTQHRHKYTYILGDKCNKVKDITYQLGSLKTNVTAEKCKDIANNFSEQVQVHLSVVKICQKYFKELPVTNFAHHSGVIDSTKVTSESP